MKIKFDDKYKGKILTEVQDKDIVEGVFIVPKDIKVIDDEAFKGNSLIKKVILPEGLEKISTSAFEYCDNLESINIPSTVNEIGEYAFYKCSKLESIEIPNGVKHLLSGTFCECSKLKNITLPNELKSIGESTFEGCANLPEIKIPESVESISSASFKDCKKIKKIILPEKIEVINDETFANCYNLREIKFPQNLKHIFENAFSLCESLQNVEFNNGLLTLGDDAFRGCMELTSIKLPKSIENLGERVFCDCACLEKADLSELSGHGKGLSLPFNTFCECENLKDVTLPEGLTEIDTSAFARCSNLRSIKFPSSLKSIGTNAFFNSGLTSIDLPENLSSLSHYCFAECRNLKSIKLPDNLNMISSSAFADCTKLTEVKMPKNLSIIGSNAFIRCSHLEHIEIPNKVCEIGESAFSDCTMLKEISIPDNVTEIGRRTFEACSHLEKVTLSNNLQSIQYGSFFNCRSLQYINFPKNLETIESNAFGSCIKLKDVALPESLKYIESSAFKNCVELENITLPKNLINLGNNAFSNCKKITEIRIPEFITKIPDKCFSYCSLLKTIHLPENLTEIGEDSFKECKSLSKIALPKNLKIIGNSAFNLCTSLKEIEIPENLQEIRNYAFLGCSKLEELIIPESVKTIGTNIYLSCNNLKKVYLPSSLKYLSKNLYASNVVENNATELIDLYIETIENLSFFKKEQNGFSLRSENNEKNECIPVSELNINPAVLSNFWDEREILFKEQKKQSIAKLYNTLLPKLNKEQAVKLILDHNFTFLKQFNFSNLYKDEYYDFYKTIYNLGGLSSSVILKNGKTINFAQKVSEFLILKLNTKQTTLRKLTLAFSETKPEGLKPEFTLFYLNNFDELHKIQQFDYNFIAKCYNEFENVQKTNTSNRGSQRQLKPTIEKFVDYFKENKYMGVTDENKNISTTIAPYFDSQEAFDRAISIDQERIANQTPNNILGFHLKEQDVFKTIDMYSKKIKELQNVCLNKMTSIANRQFTFDWLEKNDPQNFILGKLCDCCAHLEGAGYGIMHASIVHPSIQNLVIRDSQNEIIAKSTLYINTLHGYGVCNNVEIKTNLQNNENDLQFIYEKYILGIDAFARAYNKEHKDNPIKIINVGSGFNDLIAYLAAFNKRSNNLLKSIDYGDYGIKELSHNGDSGYEQYTIWNIGDEKDERQY